MGKAGDNNPATDLFKILFGSLGKGGLPLFRNNPFRRKPEVHDAAGLKSDTERDGSLDQTKRTLNPENYRNFEPVQKKIKADNEPDVHDLNNNDDEKKKKKKKRARGECIEEQRMLDNPEESGVKSSHNIRSKEEKNGSLLKDRRGEEGVAEELVQKKEKKRRTRGEHIEEQAIFDRPEENGVKSSHNTRSKKDKNDGLLKEGKGEKCVAEELVQKKEKKKRTRAERIEERGIFDHPEENGVKSNRSIPAKEEKTVGLLKDRKVDEGVAEKLVQTKEEKKKKKSRGKWVEEPGVFYYSGGDGVKSNHSIPAKDEKNGDLLKDRKGKEGVAGDLVQTKKEKKKTRGVKSNHSIPAKDEKNGDLLKDRKGKEGVAGDLVQTKKEKKKTRGKRIEERGIFDYHEGNGVASSHNIPAKLEKNFGLLNDKKGEQSVAEELVQTKKEKKKKDPLKENQRSAQEADVDEIRQRPAAKHGKRSFEEEDGNKSSKKIKFSDLKSDVRVGRNGDVEIGKGLAVSTREQADSSKKSALGKRKWDAIEEEYEVRHGVEVDDTLAQGRSVGKNKLGKRKRGDDVADMVITESSFDDEKKLQRTVFVGNLPLRIKKKMLIREFSRFGEVESIRLRSVPILDSKLPRKSAILRGQINDSVNSVHAYIVFKDEESARAALSHNMVEFGGNHIRVDRARPPCKKLKGENNLIYDNKRTVFVGNLPFDVKDEELYQMFSGIKPFESNVEAVRVIRDPQTSIGKGIAYVLFKTRDAAKLAVKKNQFKIRDRNLRLNKVQPYATPKLQSGKPFGPSGLCGKRSAESQPMSNGLLKKKIKSPLSYQGTRASKTDEHLGKGTSLTSINKEGNSFSKSHMLQVNDPKRQKFNRSALAARRSGPPQSSAQNHASKKRKLDMEARMGSSKPSKKAKVY